MLQVARLSPRALGESSELVAAFLASQRAENGGYTNRAGRSDLYYTVFALDGLIAVHHDPLSPQIRAYLEAFGTGEGLDFVHLACLARAWATVSRESIGVSPSALLSRLEAYRTPDGGYNATAEAAAGTAYGAYLALGAYQDLRQPLPSPERLLLSLNHLRSRDGAYGNHPAMPVGQTSATAAAIAVRRQLSEAGSDAALGDWLLARVHAQGGFTAAPLVPAPDLLSTATGLHALATLHCSLDPIREICLDFIDTLWTNRGGFYGHWADDRLDCEYTYYGLLALGHLAV
jgi:hypothetical protein